MAHKRHAIITACDAKCGDFLAAHWLRSMRENVSLDDVDVIVLDYGLTPSQREAIDEQGAIRRPCSRDGFVNNLRFRDVAGLVQDASYDQILLIDSGDLIFQTDIRELFDRDKDEFRVVCEQLYTAQYEHFISTSDFDRDDYVQMVKSLRETHIINTGMILGSAKKFAALWPAMRAIAKDFQNWGTLQLVINYLFYKEGFVELPYHYNFILMTARSPYRIVDGQFFDAEGELIPVVHNAGGSDSLRFIRNFGYGPDHNFRKPVGPHLLRALFHVVNWWKRGGTQGAKRAERRKAS